MVRVACLYSGDFEPGRRSLQQQQAESCAFVKQMGWQIVKQYSEKADAKVLKMRLRKVIQTIIEDARANTFDIFIVWGIRCLSFELIESAELLYILEKAGVTVLLLDMDRMATLMGGKVYTLHTGKPQPVPDDYYDQFKKKANAKNPEPAAASTKPTKTTAKPAKVSGQDVKGSQTKTKASANRKGKGKKQ